MNLEEIIHDMESMLGRQLTLLEYRVARYSYFQGLVKGITYEMKIKKEEL